MESASSKNYVLLHRALRSLRLINHPEYSSTTYQTLRVPFKTLARYPKLDCLYVIIHQVYASSLFTAGNLEQFKSVNGGSSWTSLPWSCPNPSCHNPIFTATSSTGANVVACQSAVQCFFSSDFGSTFTGATSGLASAQVSPVPPPGGPDPALSFRRGGIAMSSSGSLVLVSTASSSGASGLYLSTNSGADYTAQPGPGSQIWRSVAMSSDGTKMAALSNTVIWTSTDSGTSWTSTALPFTAYIYSSLSLSGDGSQLLAATAIVGNGEIYTSSNFGVTWTLARKLCDNVLATCTTINACNTRLSTAVSQTGSVMAVSVLDGGLYISTDTGSTWVVAH